MPFVSKVTVSFLKPPSIETGVMPMSKHLNVMRVSACLQVWNDDSFDHLLATHDAIDCR